MQTILGIDPGSRIAGYGLVSVVGGKVTHVAHGVIIMPADKELSDRLVILGEAMQKLIERYRPQHVSVEKIFMGKNADSAFKLGHARGVVMYEAAKAGLPVAEYATRIVKKSITGNGGAEKEAVQVMLQRLLGIKEITRIDASDALALAFHHAGQIHTNVFAKRMDLREI